MRRFFCWLGGELKSFLHNLFNSRPPATTFREGQRALMVKLMSGAGIFCGLFAVWLVTKILDKGWPVELRDHQLTLVGHALILAFLGMLLVIIALMIGGPVGKTQVKLGKDGLDMNAEDKEEDADPTSKS